MKKIYDLIVSRLEKIDFGMLYPKFHCFSFALYNKDQVLFDGVFYPYDERFIGNTTIEFNEKQIAIWNMDYSINDIDVFTSKIVHEMFHAFQIEQAESRFPSEIDGLFYDYNPINLSQKIKETECLIKAFQNKSISFIDEFHSRRNKRNTEFSLEGNYEAGIETIEGTARFVELKTLGILDSTLQKKEIDKILINLSNYRNYIPIRKVSYDIGALYLLTCDLFNMKLDTNIPENNTPIIIQHSEKAKSYPEHVDIIEDVKIMTEEYATINAKKVFDFMKTASFKIKAKIVGFDPMNTIRSEEFLLFEHFVRIEVDGKQENIFGTACAKTIKGLSIVDLFIAN